MSATTSITINLCDTCAIYLSSGDDTMIDAQSMTMIDAITEGFGILAEAGTTPMPGYWQCEGCDQTVIGDDAHTFESVS